MTPAAAKDLLLSLNGERDILERRGDGGVFISLGAAIEAVCEAYLLGMREGPGGGGAAVRALTRD
ncbi:hypothetical protein [Rhodocista pekingensis]|uniref:Uncharacterized protein n=1 Tax=Rhodocista pekingensis TaxID=201185 RepID=A0ABW2KV29_9PROT